MLTQKKNHNPLVTPRAKGKYIKLIRNRSKIVNKKNSKYLAVLAAMGVFSILLASCQSMLANTEETEINRAVEAWGANLTAQGESYLEEMEQASVPWIELRSDVPFESEEMQQASVPWIELRSDVPFESEGMEQASVPWIELRSDVPFESEEMQQASIPLPGVSYFESYLEEMEQAGVPLYELRDDVSAEAEVMVAAFSPGIEIQRTWLESRSFLTVYTVTSDRPAWVVFHADQDGLPGAILRYIFVGSGTHSIARVENVAEISSDQIHVMLHQDLGRLSVFEFPGPDGPLYVGEEIVNVRCFCP